MNNVMTDIETTGTGHHSAITNIAAAVFDLMTGKIIAEYYARVDWKEDCELCGGKIDAATMAWWMRKSSEARMELTADDNRVAPDDALMGLFSFIQKHCGSEPVYMWAKSPSFDLSLIKDAAERFAIPRNMIPWKFWNERDVRTIEGIAASLNIPLPYGKKDVTHHALSDVRGQIRNVAAVMSVLGEAVEA